MKNDEDRLHKKMKKEREKHEANLLDEKDLEILIDYLYHNRWYGKPRRRTFSPTIAGQRELEVEWRWPHTMICHGGITYDFEITAEWGVRLKVHRYVYRNGYKTNARVLRTLVEKHYEAIVYLSDIDAAFAKDHQLPVFYPNTNCEMFMQCKYARTASAELHSFFEAMQPLLDCDADHPSCEKRNATRNQYSNDLNPQLELNSVFSIQL